MGNEDRDGRNPQAKTTNTTNMEIRSLSLIEYYVDLYYGFTFCIIRNPTLALR